MTPIEFTDPQGVRWRVWSTIPSASSPLARYYPGGWLTFDSGGSTLRRLSPVPKGWETCSPERMDLMRRAAEEVPRHTGEMVKMARPEQGPLADAPEKPEIAEASPPRDDLAPPPDEDVLPDIQP